MEISIESVLGIKEKNFYSIITRIQSEIISIKLKNPPNIYLKVFDTILNFYTTVEYNECKYCIATLLFTESDTLCLLNWQMYFVLLLSLI